jgi:hypothetical protein
MRGITKALVAATVAAAMAAVPAAAKAVFTGEDVSITVAPPLAKVEGKYTFSNAGDEADTLEVDYPFPRGPDLGKPDKISVRDAEGGDIPFSWKRHVIVFEIVVPARSEAVVSVAFEQSCEGCEYEYVVASKRGWQRPIAEATYAVVAPVQLAPVDCPYEWEEVPAAEGLVRYEFSREDFYPDVDLVVRWKRPDFYFGSTALEGDAP